MLEHQALDTAGAALLAHLCQRLPVRGLHQRRHHQRLARERGLQLRAAQVLRQRPQVLPGHFQQVIGDEAHRHIGQQLAAERLALDALLQRLEWRRAVVGAPGQQFTVEHGAVGQAGGLGHHLGKAVGDQFLAA